MIGKHATHLSLQAYSDVPRNHAFAFLVRDTRTREKKFQFLRVRLECRWLQPRVRDGNAIDLAESFRIDQDSREREKKRFIEFSLRNHRGNRRKQVIEARCRLSLQIPDVFDFARTWRCPYFAKSPNVSLQPEKIDIVALHGGILDGGKNSEILHRALRAHLAVSATHATRITGGVFEQEEATEFYANCQNFRFISEGSPPGLCRKRAQIMCMRVCPPQSQIRCQKKGTHARTHATIICGEWTCAAGSSEETLRKSTNMNPRARKRKNQQLSGSCVVSFSFFSTFVIAASSRDVVEPA